MILGSSRPVYSARPHRMQRAKPVQGDIDLMHTNRCICIHMQTSQLSAREGSEINNIYTSGRSGNYRYMCRVRERLKPGAARWQWHRFRNNNSGSKKKAKTSNGRPASRLFIFPNAILA